MSLNTHPDMLELRRIVLRLSLISHAPIQGYEFAPSEVGRGQRWRTSNRNPPIPHLGQHHSHDGDTQLPQGNVDRKGDLSPDYRQKSAEYFRRRFSWIRTEQDLATLLQQARDALEAWQHTPQVAGVELERDSFLWRCEIADSDLPLDVVKRKYTVSRATVYRYRAKYRGLRRRAA